MLLVERGGTLDEAARTWWGERALLEGTAVALRVGPLSLWMATRGSELWVASHSGDGLLDSSVSVEQLPDQGVPEGHELIRIGRAKDNDGRVVLSPLLADRPVVVRPESRFLLPRRVTVQGFVSTLVWVRVSTGEHSLDLPPLPPKSTWFGPSPREGLVAYASRTRLRMSRDELVHLPHRAITLVSLHNHGKEPLDIQRVRLPIPALALYATAESALFTDAVDFELAEDPSLTEVRIRPPPDPGERIAEPHRKGDDNVLLRMLNFFA